MFLVDPGNLNFIFFFVFIDAVLVQHNPTAMIAGTDSFLSQNSWSGNARGNAATHRFLPGESWGQRSEHERFLQEMVLF